MNKILLLDLEETLIPIWGDWWPIPENCQKIKKFIEEFQPDIVETFSFAIWDQNDIETFKHIKGPIEKTIGTKFNVIRSMEQIINAMHHVDKTLFLHRNDLPNIFGKGGTITTLIMKNWRPDSHVILIDDAVIDMEMKTKNAILEMKNINNM